MTSWISPGLTHPDVGVRTSQSALARSRRADYAWWMAADRPSTAAIGRSFIEAFNRRDPQGLIDLCDPDIEFHPTSLVGERTVYRGHDGLRQWVSELRTAMIQHQVRVLDVRALDENRLVVLSEVLVDGEQLSPSAMVATLSQAGKIVEAHAYLSDRQLLERLGLVPGTHADAEPAPQADPYV